MPRGWTSGIIINKNHGSSFLGGHKNFKNLYFSGYWLTSAVLFGLLNKCGICECFRFSTVYFGVQFYSTGTSVTQMFIIKSCFTFNK